MVCCGTTHAVAVSVCGQVWSWGEGLDGRLGHGDLSSVPAPRAVEGISHADFVAVSASTSAAVAGGRLYTWGCGTYGGLGHGDLSDRKSPCLVEAMVSRNQRVTTVSLAKYHSCAITRDGSLFAFGYGANGRLGLGHTQDNSTPTQVPCVSRVMTVACADHHTAAITQGGDLYSWGRGDHGELGQDDGKMFHCSPVKLQLSKIQGYRWSAVCVTANFTLALSKSGQLWQWGGANANDCAPTQLASDVHKILGVQQTGGRLAAFWMDDGAKTSRQSESTETNSACSNPEESNNDGAGAVVVESQPSFQMPPDFLEFTKLWSPCAAENSPGHLMPDSAHTHTPFLPSANKSTRPGLSRCWDPPKALGQLLEPHQDSEQLCRHTQKSYKPVALELGPSSGLGPELGTQLQQLYTRVSSDKSPVTHSVEPRCEDVDVIATEFNQGRDDANFFFEWNGQLKPETAFSTQAGEIARAELAAEEHQAEELKELISTQVQRQELLKESLAKAKQRAQHKPGMQEHLRLVKQIEQTDKSIRIVQQNPGLPETIAVNMVSKLERDFEKMCSKYGM
eukprot:TRINITY_DN44454_c0_g1_i1.p1 TRINITY_DN44454_c0_g1~~TRINITY_DN44454_c0_g1_i1.p1  ORF type:complete len:565 (-),score=87.73 TRINITY_DN44454_c0_g1_i1:248-1942(-)